MFWEVQECAYNKAIDGDKILRLVIVHWLKWDTKCPLFQMVIHITKVKVGIVVGSNKNHDHMQIVVYMIATLKNLNSIQIRFITLEHLA